MDRKTGGRTLSYTFEVWASDGTGPVGTAPISSTTVSGVLSGVLASIVPPALDNGLYEYRVQVTNGLTSTAWSAWHVFTTLACDLLQSVADTTATDPTTGAAVRVLNWADGDMDISQVIEPDGFDATTATDAQLEFYGLPARPSDPLDPTDPASQDAWDAWHAAVDDPWDSHTQPLGPDTFCALPAGTMSSPSNASIDPDFTVDPSETTDARSVAPNPVDSFNWGGEVATAHADYKWVSGEFTVPSYTQCASNQNPDSHSSWVGIGGWNGSSKLMQNGISSGGGPHGDGVAPFAWWEVANSNNDTYQKPVLSSLVRVKSGDDIAVTTSYNPTTKKATFRWNNKTSRQNYAITVTGHADNPNAPNYAGGYMAAHYDGRYAEAIDERNAFNGYYDWNRPHSGVNWLYVNVSTASNGSSPTRIRTQAHDELRMTNVYHVTVANPHPNPTVLDKVSAPSGYPGRFSMTWNSCGRHDSVPH